MTDPTIPANDASPRTICVESAQCDGHFPEQRRSLSLLSASDLAKIHHKDIGNCGGMCQSYEATGEVVKDLSGRVIEVANVSTSDHQAASTMGSPSPQSSTTDLDITSDRGTMKVWPQVLVCLVASLGHLILGTVLAYPAIALPPLTTYRNCTPFVTQDEVNVTSPSWITSELTPDMFITEISWAATGTESSANFADRFRELPSTEEDTTTPDYEDLCPSTAIPTLYTPFPSIYLQPKYAVWFASLHALGALLGSLVCGSLMASVGQRRAVLITTPVVLVTWLATWAAFSVYLLLVTRIVLGVCIGILGTSVQVYIVETSHKSVRGSLTCVTDIYVSLGILLAYALGALDVGWRWSAFILGVITTVPLVVGMALFPDSPRYLALRGRKEDAHRALQFFRGPNCNVTQELEMIMQVCSDVKELSIWEQFSTLKCSATRTPFLTTCGVYILGQMAGPFVVYSYAVTIFQEANTGLSPYISAVMIGIARLLGTCVSPVVVERAGRRPSLIVGAVGVTLSLLVLGSYFQVKVTDPISALSINWMPVICLVIYTVIVGATVSPIPFLLSSELLPITFRSVGSATSKVVFFTAGLVVMYSFLGLQAVLGLAVLFWSYAVSSFLLMLLVAWVVPETKGKTLEEIEEYYNLKSM
ncbi:probable metabolite transport protein CsbC isoform X2 [Cherax quadricarinatus]|uniref:probable metabolite transport protein CsbC isoform X2 n=1 Tax=Cherax quadricarinatus TaxID=27406 RepID=UPI0023794AD9|nr:facilitated trehalose transporter Tret1-like isoform X2 [Cherax quadricarinatus]